MSLPEIAMNKGYVCHLNPLCKCGVHSVLLTAYTEDNVGKIFFFVRIYGVMHLRTSCNDFESKLIATRNELAIQKEEMQSVSVELAKTRTELEFILNDKTQSLEFIKSEMRKLSRGVYDVWNVISGKNLDK
ncbi:hypothetical protein ACFE04_030042 [Oxalis oulophora]